MGILNQNDNLLNVNRLMPKAKRDFERVMRPLNSSLSSIERAIENLAHSPIFTNLNNNINNLGQDINTGSPSDRQLVNNVHTMDRNIARTMNTLNSTLQQLSQRIDSMSSGTGGPGPTPPPAPPAPPTPIPPTPPPTPTPSGGGGGGGGVLSGLGISQILDAFRNISGKGSELEQRFATPNTEFMLALDKDMGQSLDIVMGMAKENVANAKKWGELDLTGITGGMLGKIATGYKLGITDLVEGGMKAVNMGVRRKDMVEAIGTNFAIAKKVLPDVDLGSNKFFQDMVTTFGRGGSVKDVDEQMRYMTSVIRTTSQQFGVGNADILDYLDTFGSNIRATSKTTKEYNKNFAKTVKAAAQFKAAGLDKQDMVNTVSMGWKSVTDMANEEMMKFGVLQKYREKKYNLMEYKSKSISSPEEIALSDLNATRKFLLEEAKKVGAVKGGKIDVNSERWQSAMPSIKAQIGLEGNALQEFVANMQGIKLPKGEELSSDIQAANTISKAFDEKITKPLIDSNTGLQTALKNLDDTMKKNVYVPTITQVENAANTALYANPLTSKANQGALEIFGSSLPQVITGAVIAGLTGKVVWSGIKNLMGIRSNAGAGQQSGNFISRAWQNRPGWLGGNRNIPPTPVPPGGPIPPVIRAESNLLKNIKTGGKIVLGAVAVKWLYDTFASGGGQQQTNIQQPLQPKVQRVSTGDPIVDLNNSILDLIDTLKNCLNCQGGGGIQGNNKMISDSIVPAAIGYAGYKMFSNRGGIPPVPGAGGPIPPAGGMLNSLKSLAKGLIPMVVGYAAMTVLPDLLGKTEQEKADINTGVGTGWSGGYIGMGILKSLKDVTPGLSATGKLLKNIPIIGTVLSLGLSAVDIATAEDKNRAIATNAGGLSGGIAGGMAGAALGTLIFPGVGTAIGGVIGGILGGIGGENIAAFFYDNWNDITTAMAMTIIEIGDWWDGLWKDIGIAWDGFVKGISKGIDDIGKWWNKGIEDIGKAWNKGVDDICKWWNDGIAAIGAGWNQFWLDVGLGWSNFWSGINNFFTSIPTWIDTNLSQPFSTTLTNISTWVDDNISKPFNTTLTNISTWIDENISKPFKKFFDDITLWMSNLTQLFDVSKWRIPGMASGKDNVPYDSYPALLHKGEMVLPASKANWLRASMGQSPVSESAVKGSKGEHNKFVQSLPSYAGGIDYVKSLSPSYENANPNEWLLGEYAGLDKTFAGRLAKIAKDKNRKLYVSSGYRSDDTQRRIIRDTLEQHKKAGDRILGSDGAIRNLRGQMMVAAPGKSPHRTGMAADVRDWGTRVSSGEYNPYGIFKPMSWENWHLQPVETRGMRTANIEEIYGGKSQGTGGINTTGITGIKGTLTELEKVMEISKALSENIEIKAKDYYIDKWKNGDITYDQVLPKIQEAIKLGKIPELAQAFGTNIGIGMNNAMGIGVAGNLLGSVSAKYESGNRGPGTISSGKGDAGGKSYGTHQFSSKKGSLMSFIKNSGYADKFKGVVPTSATFDNIWTSLAASDPNFGKAQHLYIAKNYFDVGNNILRNMGMDFSKKSRAIQEMIWSTSVQYGPGGAGKVFGSALRGMDINTMSDTDIINIVQKYKKATVGSWFRSSARNTQENIATRSMNELNDLLQLVNTPAISAYRLGGLINNPQLALMGEQAPNYPEYVIPTNPKYKNRAADLIQRASEDVGVSVSSGSGGIVVNVDSDSTEVVGNLQTIAGKLDELINVMKGSRGFTPERMATANSTNIRNYI